MHISSSNASGDAHRPWSCPSGNFRWCPVRHFRNLQTCNGVIVQSAKVLFSPISVNYFRLFWAAQSVSLELPIYCRFSWKMYPDPSVCLFVGLIAGMLPSLMREAGK